MNRYERTAPSGAWPRRLGAFVVALCLAMVAQIAVALPAHAAGALTVDKTVDQVTRAAGDEFTYSIQVGCDDENCEDAVLVDQLPPEFAGFQILNTTVGPAVNPSSFSYAGCATTVTADCRLSVSFLQQVGGGAVGITAGGTYQISISLKAPPDLPPTWPYNDVAVTNTATATSTTAATVSDSADVTVSIPITVATATGKTWQPDSQQFEPGAASSITLSSQNTSNVPAETLVVQDPGSAADGATSLDAGNPFTLVDFTGFGAVTLPAGATSVQVDAYVLDPGSGTYSWVVGTATTAAAIALPAGVATADVAGLRYTFRGDAGAVIVPGGAAGTVATTVAQRATNRQTGASSVGGAAVTNTATGTVTVPGRPPASTDAQAGYEIGALDVAVSAGKSIAPSRIPGGTTALATLTGKNDSNGPVDTLSISDQDFFTDTLAFGGFASAITYPAGATAATITWSFSDGSTVAAAVADGATPAPPAAPAGAHLTGFAVGFTGSISPGAAVDLQFAIAPDADFVTQGASPDSVTNAATVTATNAAGSADATATAGLEVFFPDIELTLNKSIAPSAPVAPGGTVVSQLPTGTSTDSAFVNPTSIVVEDVWDDSDAGNFWNAFDPIAIAPTQVLAGSTLLIEVTTDGGATWSQFALVDATAGSQVYSADLPGGVEGLRFTFANAAGFPQGTTVSPNTVFQARAELRDGSGPTSVPDAGPSAYDNVATAQGSGSVAGGQPVTSDPVDDSATAQIETNSGPGTLSARKEWRTPDFAGDLPLVSSQSGQAAGTLLFWRVDSTGYSSVTLTDPASDLEDPSRTVFQAFDLTAIAPRTFAQDPLLRWDQVSSVELFAGGAWTAVPAPGGSWMTGSGFAGYALTPAEVAATTGVRITVVPNDAARQASTDPLRPPPGSGIATSSGATTRSFGLSWQLRNVQRAPGAEGRFVTGTTTFNDQPGLVRNDSAVAGVRNDAPVGPLVASDLIQLIDQPPAVDVTKTTARTNIVVPNPGDVDPANYPTNVFVVTTRNDSTSRASYLRAIDPMPCNPGNLGQCLTGPADWGINPWAGASYDPSNPFERFDLTGLDFTGGAGQLDRTASQVTLWLRDAAGDLSTSRLSVAAADALPAAALADVVGVAVVYQGTDPAVDGGTISSGTSINMVMQTRVRAQLRSNPGAFVTPFAVTNYAFAQSYDPVLFPSGPSSTPRDSDNKTVNLIKGKLGVVAAKTIAPLSLIEAQRTDPVTATLTATQGTGSAAATVATHQVLIEDSDAAFWNTFRLTGLTASDVTLPAGADRVRVDVQVNGDPAWVSGVAGPTAALPAAVTDPATITGIRFTFFRADGGLFSRSAVPANFTATAVLRLQLRDAFLSTGDPIPFPSTAADTITATSHRTDNPEVYPDVTATATDDIALQPGTFRLDISKAPPGNVHTVAPGDPIPWTLTFQNTGTGFLTMNRLVDALPASLTWDGSDPQFSTTAGGLLPTDPLTTYDPATKQLTFTWPEGSRRMAPNERFTIVLGIILEPGLTGSQRATNPITATTAQPLTACTNNSGNGQGTIAGLPSNQCGTTNYVSPVPGPSLVTTKGVKGDVVRGRITGGINPTGAKIPCVPDQQGYYRSPCVARTGVGATDEWRINGVNSGTVAYRSLTIVDPLPVRGDRLLATGSARGSTYRPTFDGTFGLTTTAPAGTTVTWQVTTDPTVCVGSGTGSAWPADPTCSTHPVAASWSNGATFTGDWTAVTGLRVVYTFATSLPPGGAVSATFRTVNTPVSAADPGLAPVTAPVGPEFAWNQSGATAVPVTGSPIARAPVKAGVTLASGPLAVTKTVSGDAGDYAPAEFVFDIACTVAGASVQLGSAAALIVPANGSARIDGIPIGSACEVAERGNTGEFGETARDPDGPQTVQIDQTAAAADPVPAAQSVTFDNRYDFGGLEITKEVESEATVGELGPFGFTLNCTALLGQVVLDTAFTLGGSGGEPSYRVPDDTLPIGTTCRLAEVDPDSADRTTITGDGVVDAGDGTATVTIGGDASVVVTNAYSAGTLSVSKSVTGDGADRYGSGPFEVEARCVYTVAEATQVYTGTVSLVDGSSATFADAGGDPVVLPGATQCTLTETRTGGATSPALFTPSNVVTIVGGEPGGDPVDLEVGVQNPFEVGAITVTKAIEGTGGQRYGVGPFTVRVECSYDKDGDTTPIVWGADDDPFLDVVLEQADDYTVTVDDLLVGSRCAVTSEPVSGGANDTDFGETVVVPAQGEPEVAIAVTNTFDTGAIVVAKTLSGGDASAHRGARFEITATCTWDGAPIDIPGSATRTLTVLSPVTYAELPVGADCAITETGSGGADGVTLNPADPADSSRALVTVAAGAAASITIDNRFDPPLPVTGGSLASALASALLGVVLLGSGALALAFSRRRRPA